MPITRSIRQCFLALLLVAAVASCGSHSNSGRAPQTAPLSQRLSGLSGQFDLLPPWFTTATEAGPLTRFSVDGAAPTTVSDLFVVGKVGSVESGPGLSYRGYTPQVEGEKETAGRSIVDFNSDLSDVDVVVVSVTVMEGVRSDGSSVTGEVRFGIALPAPTDLASLQKEWVGLEIGALLVRNEGTSAGLDFDDELFEVVGYGMYFGTVEGAVVSFGQLTESPYSFPAETVTVDAVMKGAGLITLKTIDGNLEKVD